jgi:aspartate dehydrogenase
MQNNKKIEIGIIGCGCIGAQLAQAVEKQFSQQAKLSALCDIDRRKAERIKMNSSFKPKICTIDELINLSQFVIEAAAVEVAEEIAQKTIQRGKDVMIISVGGILDKYARLLALAQSKGCHIYIPSGALGGLDVVKSAAMARIEKVILTTRKPVQGLIGAPYLEENNIDLSNIRKETVIFEGSASEAIKGFPKNVNVCATLSLAGIGSEKTKVKIITAPDYKFNTHEIQVEGEFGRLSTITENVQSAENPRTSYLASLSAIATLKEILGAVKIGT